MKVLRNLVFLLVLAAIGAVVAHMLLSGDTGLLLIRYGGMDYTANLVEAIGIALLVLLVLWGLWTLLSLPFRSWNRHRDRQARLRLSEGLMALHAGHYTQAQKALAQAEDDPDTEPAARLSAAQAAWARGDAAGARRELEGFGDRHPAARAIATAELALAEERPTDALVALDAPSAQPLPPRGLALRAEALAASGQASQAYELLGALRQQDALSKARLDEVEGRWAAASLQEAEDGNVLAARWEALPKTLRTERPVASAYAERAAALGWHEAAARSLEQALDSRWDERLVTRYGALPLQRVEHRASTCERWLRQHPGSPALLLALARLSAEQAQWNRAEDYARRAIEQGAGANAWEVLGDTWLAQGDEAGARFAYGNALRAGRDQPVAVLPPRERITLMAPEAAPEADPTIQADPAFPEARTTPTATGHDVPPPDPASPRDPR